MAPNADKPTVGDVIAQVYALLAPLDAQERAAVLAAVGAAFRAQGSPASAGLPPKDGALPPADGGQRDIGGGVDGLGLGQAAQTYLRRMKLSQDDLDEVFVFHGEGDVEVNVAELPGETAKEQTINGYLLIGVAALLATDTPEFTEKKVTDFLKAHGAHNQANHAAYRKALGNAVTGSKRSGFKLTKPGLRQAGEVIRELTNGA